MVSERVRKREENPEKSHRESKKEQNTGDTVSYSGLSGERRQDYGYVTTTSLLYHTFYTHYALVYGYRISMENIKEYIKRKERILCSISNSRSLDIGPGSESGGGRRIFGNGCMGVFGTRSARSSQYSMYAG